MNNEYWEAVDPAGDPLEILLRREDEESYEADVLQSQYRSGLAQTHPKRPSDDREYIEPTFH